MIVYVNVMSGHRVTRPGPDEWLDASSGWKREQPAKGETGSPSSESEQEPAKGWGEENTHGRS